MTKKEAIRLTKLMEQWETTGDENFIKEMWQICDIDNSGYIEKSEVIAIMTAQKGSCTDEEANVEIAESDSNKDRKVSKAEFYKTLKTLDHF